MKRREKANGRFDVPVKKDKVDASGNVIGSEIVEEEIDLNEWVGDLIPIFKDEDETSLAEGYVETSQENALAWAKGDYLVVRRNLDNGDTGTKQGRKYNAYKAILDASGNNTGNYTAVESLNGKAKYFPNMTAAIARCKQDGGV